MIKQQDINKLANVALFARNRSIVPISNFAVGAALLSSDGQIFVGCNIECYGQTPSICAERVALFKALSEGVTDFLALAVAGRFLSAMWCLPSSAHAVLPRRYAGICREK